MSQAFDPKRRELVGNLLLLSAALVTMPSCLRGNEAREASLRNLRLAKGQVETLSALADLIIPRTETPGAVDLEADDFALLMADECFRPEQRDLFRKGLDAFESAVRKSTGRRFRELEGSARAAFLRDLGNGAVIDEASSFLKVYRSLVVRGYTESEYFLTSIRPYEMVPGRYRGCVPVPA